ncbi:MAG: LAGLIDADG family homing endonuclease, partial [Candidatus Berkelbacteria bacterium]|nr:LAGLIDADG family homing endonuclease [Candidatus Berkelbacteria bacterium]
MPANFGWYIAGFVDGEGSFNVSFKKERSYGIGWKVALSFNISQRDAGILKKIQQAFGCGTIRFR